jgi:hypothetical protein
MARVYSIARWSPASTLPASRLIAVLFGAARVLALEAGVAHPGLEDRVGESEALHLRLRRRPVGRVGEDVQREDLLVAEPGVLVENDALPAEHTAEPFPAVQVRVGLQWDAGPGVVDLVDGGEAPEAPILEVHGAHGALEDGRCEGTVVDAGATAVREDPLEGLVKEFGFAQLRGSREGVNPGYVGH